VNLSSNSPEVQRIWQQVKQTAINTFAVITSDVMEMDWLELASSGHRRAKISLDSWKWLIP
jgi:hypothetical protein